MIAISLLALAVAASPIADAPREAPAPVSQPAAKPATRYCTVFTPTGSRIERRMCRTRGEWLALGSDPLAAK